MPLVGLYFRSVSHGVPRPPKTHRGNDQPGQLKPICESARHQEAHLLPALSHSHWPARPLAWVAAPPACRAMVTGSKGTICCVTEGSAQNLFCSQDGFAHDRSASRVQSKRRVMVHSTSFQVRSTSASGHGAFSTCSSQVVGHLRAFSYLNTNWTSDDDNDRSSIPNCISVHKEQQLATGEYYWTENIKRHPPPVKLHVNLLQTQVFNLTTILSLAAVLRVQHSYTKYQLYVPN